MLEHPVIKRLRETGYEDYPLGRVRICYDCGCSLKSGDCCYRIGTKSYCECCMEDYREEVE